MDNNDITIVIIIHVYDAYMLLYTLHSGIYKIYDAI